MKNLMDLQNKIAGRPGIDQREAIKKAEAENEAQIKQLLSPERYEDYLRSKDHDFRTFHQIAERLLLSPENAIAAYEVKADAYKRIRTLKFPESPEDLPAWNEAHAVLRQDVQKRLIETMGQRGYEAYRASNPSWMESLTPKLTMTRP
jgi:hypothetical protein